MKEIQRTNYFNENDTNLTPIEVMLEVDENGETTARKLYEFLQLDKSHFNRWAKKNIEENVFYEENKDWKGFAIMANGNKCMDYMLTAQFAKHLSMSSQSERGKQARNYFVKVEDKLKEKSTKIKPMNPNEMFLAQSIQTMATIMGQYMEENAKTVNKMSDYIQDSIVAKDAQIDEVKEMIGMRDKGVKSLTFALKDKIYELTGKNVRASNDVYIHLKNKLFRKFRVSKWEDIPVTNYDKLYSCIDEISLEDIRAILFLN